EEMQAMIAASPASDKIAAMTPTIEVFSILQFEVRGQTLTKPVRVVGINPEGRAAVGGFAEFLVRQQGSTKPSFDLTADAVERFEKNKMIRQAPGALELPPPPPKPGELPPPKMREDEPPAPQLFGIIPGYMIAHMRFRNKEGVVLEEEVLKPGDDVTLTTVGGADLKPVWGTFLVADYIKTEMSEYDQGIVYVELEQLQKIRGMSGRCTQLQIKLKNYHADKDFV